MRKNKQVAEILEEIADLLELEGVEFKPRAYRRAALTIEGLSEDINSIRKKGKLDDIPGVGESIAEKIDEYLKTGKLKYLTKLRKKTPVDVHGLSQIEGMGPKTIKKLYKNLKIKTVADLKKAAKKGLISGIRGLGKTIEKRTLEGISFRRSHNGRLLLGNALPIAEEVLERLKKLTQVKQASLAGSILRKKDTIGDVDILVSTNDPKPIMDYFTKMEGVQRVLAKGLTKASVKLKGNIQVDLRAVKPEAWGGAIQYFSGSKAHSIETRKLAIKKGYKLNEYGLFKGKKQVAKTEEQIYRKLAMQRPEPEMRENKGEIDLALKKKLPSLVQLKDIKGDMHVHSKWSDGTASILDMAKAAKKAGRKYMLQSDHTGQLKIARALSEKQIPKYITAIQKANRSIQDFRILKGAEVNIMEDGKLDIPDKTLKKFDVCVGSIHTGLRGSKSKMTKRITSAMENPYINIIGHPSGRLLNSRAGYDVDWGTVFDKSKETHTALEINCQPTRLDLTDDVARAAMQSGVKLVISTDSHTQDNLLNMKYGVYVAKRAWCEKRHILNTQSPDKLIRYFR
ncbi:MAG: DNA polymerase/3'-5' exonuclease PolX [Candidatus Nanoarchaeia archaeon]